MSEISSLEHALLRAREAAFAFQTEVNVVYEDGTFVLCFKNWLNYPVRWAVQPDGSTQIHTQMPKPAPVGPPRKQELFDRLQNLALMLVAITITVLWPIVSAWWHIQQFTKKQLRKVIRR